MRVVIDTCSLQGEELEAFFAMSPHHTALLTDYAAVESFSGDTIRNISTNMAVVAKFPCQVMAPFRSRIDDRPAVRCGTGISTGHSLSMAPQSDARPGDCL